MFLRAFFALAAGLCLSAQPAIDQPGRKLTTLQRLEPQHLEAVHQARLRFASERQSVPAVSMYQDYRAILHIHAEDADHTKGTRAEVLEGAKTAGVRVIMFTDHRGPKPETWRGLREGVLFVPGSEDDHQLRYPASPAGAELKFLSHLEERPDMPSAGFDGMEMYNRHSDSTKEKEFHAWFQKSMGDPVEWAKVVVIQKKYPAEFFAAGTDALPLFTSRWDKEIASHPFTGVAANDSHKNQIFKGVVFDPYDVAFRFVSTHILAQELTEAAIRQSLHSGHVYVSHDWLADPTGFAFVGQNNLGIFDMGDSIPMLNNTRLHAQLPLPAHLKLIRNGVVVSDTVDSKLTFTAKDPGAYRLEAWLTVDGEERPWIYSNPILVAAPTAESMQLPPRDLAPGVEARRDIAYTEGKPEDEGKHKLDLYLPKDRKNVPVFVFIHGGAWRSGDRSNYPAMANRFAKEGILTVVPSYRLAPKNQHPAQIEDVAAAFAWVVKNIEQYGGDPKRIYVGGHSAGGHLCALLTLDGRYLAKYGLSAANIRGTIPMSGVYEIAGLDSVFGSDAAQKKAASPMVHIHTPAPPFLVTYCQWDYMMLPAQARKFQAALDKAGVQSKLLYVPAQSHISEIVNVWKDDDITGRAIVEFIR